MKNSISFTLVGLILLLSILACDVAMNGAGSREMIRGSGVVVDETRNPNNFSGVQLSMEGTLHIVMGSSESLRIEAEDNLLEYIQTDVKAGKLVIETLQGVNLQSTQPIHYYLTVEELNSIGNSSSGDVEAEDLQSQFFSVTISSSGDVTISNLMADSISVKISSSGNLEIQGGQVQQQIITISSSGEYQAKDLASVEAEVTLSSSGTARIRVSDHLRGKLTSSGNIYYIGTPQVNVSTSSSGRTVPINE